MHLERLEGAGRCLQPKLCVSDLGDETRVARLGQFAEIDLGRSSPFGRRQDADKKEVSPGRLAGQRGQEKREQEKAAAFHGKGLFLGSGQGFILRPVVPAASKKAKQWAAPPGQ